MEDRAYAIYNLDDNAKNDASAYVYFKREYGVESTIIDPKTVKFEGTKQQLQRLFDEEDMSPNTFKIYVKPLTASDIEEIDDFIETRLSADANAMFADKGIDANAEATSVGRYGVYPKLTLRKADGESVTLEMTFDKDTLYNADKCDRLDARGNIPTMRLSAAMLVEIRALRLIFEACKQILKGTAQESDVGEYRAKLIGKGGALLFV